MRSTPALAATLCVLCACASAPKIDYYTLSMEPSGGVDPVANLSVERFRTTGALSRSQIMVVASPTRIEYYATDQWAGSLGELVQQKLAAEFGPSVEGRKDLVLSGQVLAFEQVDSPGGLEARVRFDVTVRDAGTPRYEQPLLEKTYEVTRAVAGSGVDAVVAELSRCVEKIAGEIAADVAKL
jgi:ABC-type uncharacterized transport system auxiliary subunit